MLSLRWASVWSALTRENSSSFSIPSMKIGSRARDRDQDRIVDGRRPQANEPLPLDETERLVVARSMVVDRCLYGVDINPMATEMAKLSLWLITMRRDRPFHFLDHALKCGR